MINWEFKSLALDSGGKPVLVSLSADQLARERHYRNALQVALSSTVANPIFSNYFVKESVAVRSGGDLIMLPAGNIEYGLCQALHGEESAVAAFRSRCGRNKDDEMVLGIVAGNPGNIPSPCGNCRDIMLEDLGKDFEIVSGAPGGGTAVVAKMSDFLFQPHCLNDKMLYRESDCRKIIIQGKILENDAYSPKDKYRGRHYYAMIETERAEYFGAHDVMCEYHPIYALRDAVRQARRAGDPFIKKVMIVCANFSDDPRGPFSPQVMYKDRQHLLELNIQGELLRGEENDPKVILAGYDAAQFEKTGKFYPTQFWRTTIKEWLPLAFSPRNFGPEFVEYLTNYYKSL